MNHSFCTLIGGKSRPRPLAVGRSKPLHADYVSTRLRPSPIRALSNRSNSSSTSEWKQFSLESIGNHTLQSIHHQMSPPSLLNRLLILPINIVLGCDKPPFPCTCEKNSIELKPLGY